MTDDQLKKSYEREEGTMRFLFIKMLVTFNHLEVNRQISYTKVLLDGDLMIILPKEMLEPYKIQHTW